MKLNCKHCQNDNNEKFATTKTGYICLCCYEKSVIATPENQKEIAEMEILSHLSKGSGGNNRRFTRAYRAMKNYLEFMKNMDDKSENQMIFIKGFSKAIELFEREAK